METEKTADVILGPDDADDVTVDIAEEEVPTDSEDKPSDKAETTDAEDKSADKSADEAEDDVDWESVLLAPEDEKASDEKDSKEESKKEAESALSDSLKTLKDLAKQLDDLPENQDANFNRLRKMNRELLKDQITKVEMVEKVTSFGNLDRVEEALTLLDGLDGYDHEIGQPSTKAFADNFASKDPDRAYNLALNLMLHKTPDGREFADVFTRRVLQLDPARLADFQAISNGEVPEGYESMISVTEDLAKVDPQFHDAFKRLTPKQREIVSDGLDQYATQSEKIEANQILQDSQKVINDVLKEQAEANRVTETLQTKIVDKAHELESASTEMIGQKITNGLGKLMFSSDPKIDLTMKTGYETKLFDLVHESPYVRGRAETFFKELGIDVPRQRIDYLYERLSNNIDIETVATVKGQKAIAEKAHQVRIDTERQLAALALGMIAHGARGTGAKLAKIAEDKVKLPKNQLPAPKKDDSSKGNDSRMLTWQEAAAATRNGKAVRAG